MGAEAVDGFEPHLRGLVRAPELVLNNLSGPAFCRLFGIMSFPACPHRSPVADPGEASAFTGKLLFTASAQLRKN